MAMRVLVIDIGGNNVKVGMPGHHDTLKVPSGPAMTARSMIAGVRRATRRWEYDVVSIGFPGPVVDGVPAREPVNLGRGWTHTDFAKAFGRPVRFINDAAMQALGSYEGGRMLFLGLGTGLGVALVVDGVVVPLEVAHLPFRKGKTFEQWVGKAGLDRLGRRRWRAAVREVVSLLKHALQADYVVLGGGNVKELRNLPPDARLGHNRKAMDGGVRLWEAPAWATAAVHPSVKATPAERRVSRRSPPVRRKPRATARKRSGGGGTRKSAATGSTS
jgi:polyphosphate glucokinase